MRLQNEMILIVRFRCIDVAVDDGVLFLLLLLLRATFTLLDESFCDHAPLPILELPLLYSVSLDQNGGLGVESLFVLPASSSDLFPIFCEKGVHVSHHPIRDDKDGARLLTECIETAFCSTTSSTRYSFGVTPLPNRYVM